MGREFVTDASNDYFYYVLVPKNCVSMSVELDWIVTAAGSDTLNVYKTNDLERARDAVAGWKADTVVEAALAVATGSDGGDIVEIINPSAKAYLFHVQHGTGTSIAYTGNVNFNIGTR